MKHWYHHLSLMLPKDDSLKTFLSRKARLNMPPINNKNLTSHPCFVKLSFQFENANVYYNKVQRSFFKCTTISSYNNDSTVVKICFY